MVVGNGMAGAWALAAHRVGSMRGRALWWFTALVQVAIAVQVTMGVGMVAGQGIDPPQFHLFYGFAGLFLMAWAYGPCSSSPEGLPGAYEASSRRCRRSSNSASSRLGNRSPIME